MLSHNDGTPIRIIVRLQPVTSPTVADLPAEADALAVRKRLVTTLQARFDAASQALASTLDAAATRGEVRARRDLWIINAIALEVQPSFVAELRALPKVSVIHLDHRRPYLQGTRVAPRTANDGVPWGITRIRAPEVWATLGISGTGATVAGMDTGVDWQHPALLSNYRGRLSGGAPNHITSWFDSVEGGLYPYDDHGHGTHTLGTAVGQHEVGVAPDARWIAVKVLDGQGYGWNSDIHAGFQWLLAPGGDPAFAPDVVICSWGATQPSSTVFQEDITLLTAAGILPVFAAGNEGPAAGTLRSPASLPGVFAVGASDPYEQVALFSSRGPSPWGEIKPYVVAPGVEILSALPGGTYGQAQGTSMATPHVAGVAALLRSVSPTLSLKSMVRIITETAVPLSTTIPNNESGWGRIDAYAAVLALTNPGVISGTVQAAGSPLCGAQVAASPRAGGHTIQTTTGPSGGYTLALPEGIYDLTATAFGYAPETVWGVTVTHGSHQRHDFTLSDLPTGLLKGTVTVLPGGEPPTLPVTLHVYQTPITATLDHRGQFALELPTGLYTVTLQGNGYRILTDTVKVTASQITARDYALTPAPTLILVDEGGWYYRSQIPYWRDALDSLAYAYDLYSFTTWPEDTPALPLEHYDVVLWSSPNGSPGLVRAGAIISDYLKAGGRLLLSGQDVAYIDSGNALIEPPQAYLVDQLATQFVSDDAPVRTLQGQGPFAGISITIAGGTGANNQIAPDVIAIADPDVAQPIWQYSDVGLGGVAAATCTPYRALFFSFGYEAIAAQNTRHEVMARALDWLTRPPPTTGLTLSYNARPPIALPGTSMTYTLRVRHVGQAGLPDSVSIETVGNTWPVTVTPEAFTLAPCTVQTVTVSVRVPVTAPLDAHDWTEVRVHSSQSSEVITQVLHTKTPAPILLVDDDRWFDVEERYHTALNQSGFAYDTWDIEASGEIPMETLQGYPTILWFTGYDWYAPVTPEEETRLLAYLDAGGRLLLSSQDFLYPDSARALGRRLGVDNVIYDRATQTAVAVTEHPAGGLWGPVRLDYPFRNWSDAIEPTKGATIVARGDEGQPIALAHAGLAEAGTPRHNWRTVFYAIPLESLPTRERTEALAAAVGWLSPLGRSTWNITPTAPLQGAWVTHTMVLRNDDPVAHEAVFTHTVPAALTVDPLSLPSELTQADGGHTLVWQGTVPSETELTFRWRARVDPGVQTDVPLTLSVTLALPRWHVAFTRAVALQVSGPDIGASHWVASDTLESSPDGPITLTLELHNSGTGVMSDGTVDVWLPPGVAPLTATLPPTQGLGFQIWHGDLAPGASHLLTLPVKPWVAGHSLQVDALLNDGAGRRLERALRIDIDPWHMYLPLIFHGWYR